MQSTNLHQIKPSSVEHRSGVPWGGWWRKGARKGQLQAMIFGWGRWYPVESVGIERMMVVAHVDI